MGRLLYVILAVVAIAAAGCQGQSGNNEETPTGADAPQLQQPTGDPAL
ncbi:MAG: hypothetical protein ACK4XJ_08755 [Fimbriimonadaceae bacterium]